MYLLGFDIGSSSIKIALVEAHTSKTIAIAQYPELEMPMTAPKKNQAEQDPDFWWHCCTMAMKKLLLQTNIDINDIKAIGIAYQMHGLVTIDKNGKPLRPAIIWCDSRAINIGEKAYDALGNDFCMKHYLNSPGNFTASKLKWVKDNEFEVFDKIDKIMLPGDYIAYQMTGEINTTISGLSEGIFWDFFNNEIAYDLLDYYDCSADLLAHIKPTFAIQGQLTKKAAQELGLKTGIPISYRAGDQPNNALSLNVLNPGEMAATGGTSGVVYAISDVLTYDTKNRINSFAHVNHSVSQTSIGILLCINGAGSQYGWVKKQFADSGLTYKDLEKMASTIPIGADGLLLLPFGNGAERMLGNKNIGAHIANLHFNHHQKAHIYRATLEGIAFAFVYGIDILKSLGIHNDIIRVGNDNLFQSAIFSQTIANLTGNQIEMLQTTGAIGAAIASGVGIGYYNAPQEALSNIAVVKKYEPNLNTAVYQDTYYRWKAFLSNILQYNT